MFNFIKNDFLFKILTNYINLIFLKHKINFKNVYFYNFACDIQFNMLY